jgi:hypothetical protein
VLGEIMADLLESNAKHDLSLFKVNRFAVGV